MSITVTPIPRLTVLTTPAFTLGTTNTAGAAITAVASNSTILTYDTTVPTTIAYGATAATGAATVSSRRDHTHGNVADPTADISCRLTHDAAQDIANSTQTALAFNTETFDTDTMHDTVTNNSRITFKTAGKYLINANWTWGAHASGFRRGRILVGGSLNIAMVQTVTPAAGNPRMTLSCIYSFSVDDYITLVVDQDSGTTLIVSSESLYSPIFSAIKILG